MSSEQEYINGRIWVESLYNFKSLLSLDCTIKAQVRNTVKRILIEICLSCQKKGFYSHVAIRVKLLILTLQKIVPSHMRLEKIPLDYVQKCLKERHSSSTCHQGSLLKFKKETLTHCTLCCAKIKTRCWPPWEPPGLADASKPIPHSSSISWRATSLGEWSSSWSSDIMSRQPGTTSEMILSIVCGGWFPITSNGWLQTFRRYCNACKLMKVY